MINVPSNIRFPTFQAFSSLAEAAYEAADVNEETDEPDTYCLSVAFAPIVQKLLGTTDRPDGMYSGVLACHLHQNQICCDFNLNQLYCMTFL